MKANCASVFLLLVGLACPGFSQTADSMKTSSYLSGGVTVTNNGISLLPTFMLGKPAVMFDLSVGKGKVSFEPQFRFSLQGKPWSFIFWWRYHAVNAGRFQLNVGAHPAIAFKTVPAPNEVTGEMLVSKRALAGEVVPTYRLTKNVNVGLYYLHAHGFDPGISKATHFLALRAGFSNIPLSKQISLRASPQLYYLNLDGTDGVYATATFTLVKKEFPFTLQSIVNKTIRTRIPSKDFIWNVSLIYAFNKKIIGI